MQVSSFIRNVLLGQHSRQWTHQRCSDFSAKNMGLSFDIDIYLPPNFYKKKQKLPVLFLNDGQDATALELMNRLNTTFRRSQLVPFLVVGIKAVDRMHTYGTSTKLDYMGRGSKARAYGHFITQELLPWLQEEYRASEAPQAHTFAGCSLGGLSALDIVWNYPDIFGQAGVFSGSLWWRSKAYDPKYPDANRIMHTQCKKAALRPGLRFWFQTGTLDETEDRNNNGIIDSIDDTKDLIAILRQLGYEDIEYVEVEGGEHNPQTWGRIFPQFLRWGFSS